MGIVPDPAAKTSCRLPAHSVASTVFPELRKCVSCMVEAHSLLPFHRIEVSTMSWIEGSYLTWTAKVLERHVLVKNVPHAHGAWLSTSDTVWKCARRPRATFARCRSSTRTAFSLRRFDSVGAGWHGDQTRSRTPNYFVPAGFLVQFRLRALLSRLDV